MYSIFINSKSCIYINIYIYIYRQIPEISQHKRIQGRQSTITVEPTPASPVKRNTLGHPTPDQRRNMFTKAKSTRNILRGRKFHYLYKFTDNELDVVERGAQSATIEHSGHSIGGVLLLEAAKLKALPSASTIKVASRFRPLNLLEQVCI